MSFDRSALAPCYGYEFHEKARQKKLPRNRSPERRTLTELRVADNMLGYTKIEHNLMDIRPGRPNAVAKALLASDASFAGATGHVSSASATDGNEPRDSTTSDWSTKPEPPRSPTIKDPFKRIIGHNPVLDRYTTDNVKLDDQAPVLPALPFDDFSWDAPVDSQVSATDESTSSATVKKASVFKAVDVSKNYLAKSGVAQTTKTSGDKAAAAPSTAQPAVRPRLIAKSGSKDARTLSTGATSTGAVGPDANSVWNKNRPVPAPVPKQFTDEELKQQYGIHMATRLQADEAGQKSKWADLDDDDDDWIPDTVQWADGTKSVIRPKNAAATQAAAQKTPIAAVKSTENSAEKTTEPRTGSTVSTPGKAVLRPITRSTSASVKPGLVLKSVPETPPVEPASTPVTTTTKSPWAALPPVDVAPPVAFNPPPQATPAAPAPIDQPIPAQDGNQAIVGPAKEIAADDFNRAPTTGERHIYRDLFNPQSGVLERTLGGRRVSRSETSGVRAPEVLQRPNQNTESAGESPAIGQSQPASAPVQTPSTATQTYTASGKQQDSADNAQSTKEELAMQAELMRRKIQENMKRKEEEQERERLAKEERIRARLEALGPAPPKAVSTKEAPKSAEPAQIDNKQSTPVVVTSQGPSPPKISEAVNKDVVDTKPVASPEASKDAANISTSTDPQPTKIVTDIHGLATHDSFVEWMRTKKPLPNIYGTPKGRTATVKAPSTATGRGVPNKTPTAAATKNPQPSSVVDSAAAKKMQEASRTAPTTSHTNENSSKNAPAASATKPAETRPSNETSITKASTSNESNASGLSSSFNVSNDAAPSSVNNLRRPQAGNNPASSTATQAISNALGSWGSPSLGGSNSATGNVWGPPTSDKSLGNGAFEVGFQRLGSAPQQSRQNASQPVPIGPPSSSGRSQTDANSGPSNPESRGMRPQQQSAAPGPIGYGHSQQHRNAASYKNLPNRALRPPPANPPGNWANWEKVLEAEKASLAEAGRLRRERLAEQERTGIVPSLDMSGIKEVHINTRKRSTFPHDELKDNITAATKVEESKNVPAASVPVSAQATTGLPMQPQPQSQSQSTPAATVPTQAAHSSTATPVRMPATQTQVNSSPALDSRGRRMIPSHMMAGQWGNWENTAAQEKAQHAEDQRLRRERLAEEERAGVVRSLDGSGLKEVHINTSTAKTSTSDPLHQPLASQPLGNVSPAVNSDSASSAQPTASAQLYIGAYPVPHPKYVKQGSRFFGPAADDKKVSASTLATAPLVSATLSTASSPMVVPPDIPSRVMTEAVAPQIATHTVIELGHSDTLPTPESCAALFNGLQTRPVVRFPPQQATVRLPPPVVAPVTSNVTMPEPPHVNAQAIVNQVAWQDRFNGLLKPSSSHTPPSQRRSYNPVVSSPLAQPSAVLSNTAVALESSDRSTTVSLPRDIEVIVTVRARSLTAEDDPQSKPCIEETMDDRELGSTPPVRIPSKECHESLPYAVSGEDFRESLKANRIGASERRLEGQMEWTQTVARIPLAVMYRSEDPNRTEPTTLDIVVNINAKHGVKSFASPNSNHAATSMTGKPKNRRKPGRSRAGSAATSQSAPSPSQQHARIATSTGGKSAKSDVTKALSAANHKMNSGKARRGGHRGGKSHANAGRA